MAVIPPGDWNSVNRPIVYRRTFTDVQFNSVIGNSTGVRLLIPSATDLALFSDGMRVYVPSGIYAGNFTVLNVGSNGIDIAATFTATASGSVKPMTNDTVTVNAGFVSTHPAHLIFPYQQIAQFTAIPGVNGETKIDVSEFLKKVFKNIMPPVGGRDYRLMIPFDVELSGYFPTTKYCMNSTVTSDALTPKVTFGYTALQNGEPIHFKDGVCMYSIMMRDDEIGPYPLTIYGVDGVGNPGGLGYDAIGSTFTIG